MSLLSKAGRTTAARIRRNKEARRRLVSSNVDKGIAFQIRATRESRGWSQTDLADKAEMAQNNISRLESPDYGKQTISSLKRIANALDVALVVRLVPFGQYIDWLSETPHLDLGLRPDALAVPSFEDEEKSGALENQFEYVTVNVTPKIDILADHASIVAGIPPQRETPSAPELRGVYHNPIVSWTGNKVAA